jgi:ABC-type transporter Mla subunit MlaD
MGVKRWSDFAMAEITIRVSDGTLRVSAVVVSVIVIAIVFLHFWVPGVFAPKYQLRVYVPEVSGLDDHTQVRLNGKLVGSVSAIKFVARPESPERRMELDLRVDKRYQDAILSDSVATSVPDGLLGPHFVSIRGGFKGTVVPPGGEIPFVPAKDISFADVVKSAQKMADCLHDDKSSTEGGKQVTPEVVSKPRP